MPVMDLHLVLGPPGSGKTGRALAQLRAAAAEGLDAFLVVPGAADRGRYLRELAANESGVLVGVEVGTFETLVERIAGSPPVRRTDRAMERVVTRDALRDVAAFREAAAWSGFVETARRHVDQLRRAQVWGGPELERALEDLPGGRREDWDLLARTVGRLLDERRIRDDAWFEQRASDAVRRRRANMGAVVVHGFDALPARRVELIERLASTVPVLVTLPWRPGRRIHERAGELRDRWRARGAFIEELDGAPGIDPLLAWTADELFEDSPAPRPTGPIDADAPAPVSFIDCCGAIQECEEVVREAALLASRGLDWDDIAVVSAAGDQHAEPLLAAFRRAGIPARLQARRVAIDVPVGRALHALVDAVCEGDAIALLGALRAPLFGLDPARVDTCELQLRAARHGTRDPLRHPALRRVLPPVVIDVLAADGRSSSPSVVASMRALLAELLPADTGELDLVRGIAAGIEGLVVAAGGEQGIELADVRELIASFPLAVPDRSDSGAVVIASIDDLRSVTFASVILRGMHLAGFRARVEDEADGPRAARDLLHLAVTRARRTLRVIRQSAGADGGELAPSPAWVELRRLLPDAPLRTRRLGAVIVAPDDVRLAHEAPAALALAQGHGIQVDHVDASTAALVERTRRHARSTQLRGEAAASVRDIRSIAVTALESYATCSAKWFIERRLRISDPDDDRTRLTEGNVAHELLRTLAPMARLEDATLQELQEHARVVLPEIVAKADPIGVLDDARLERVTRHVLATLDAEAEWRVPDGIDVERDIGGADVAHAFGPGLVVDGVEVVGRVDRIDRFGSRLLLHDYKYSSTPRPAGSLVADRNLQLAVYWLALEQPGSTFEPIGAIYRSLTAGGAASGIVTELLRELGVVAPGKRAGVLDDDAREALLDDVRTLVEASVAGIRSGVVKPLRHASLCPSHCGLQAICRVGEGHGDD